MLALRLGMIANMAESISIIRFLGIRLGIYLASVGVAYVLATMTASQSVIARLGGMGVDVSFADRFSMTLHDLAGMAGMFLPIVAFALLLAFLVTALLCRWLGAWRWVLYPLAGGVALVCIHVALNLAFQITPIAVARSPLGLLVQGLSGAAGGYTYVALLQRFRRRKTDVSKVGV